MSHRSKSKIFTTDAVWLDSIPHELEVMFFISSRSGMQVKRPAVGAEGYVLNHLDKPSVDDYLKTTGDRLFTAFDKTDIPYSVFCDSLEVYNQDWTDDFLTEFQRVADTILNHIFPALVMDIGPQRPRRSATTGVARSLSFSTRGS